MSRITVGQIRITMLVIIPLVFWIGLGTVANLFISTSHTPEYPMHDPIQNELPALGND
jgi:hypothetical protein